ncbi:MAG TPA: right-handed parallel beta-helix repeat-containing protein [Thermoplasmata archaeon]|nr:right-handed parallel beta-helix repeat-containing protein [Thermoplasmata archaeon]
MRLSWAGVAGIALIAVLMVMPSNGVSAPAGRPASPSAQRPDSVGPAAFTGLVTILPSGVVAPSGAPISTTGSTYTVASSFSGSILDERNGSTLNGAGYVLTVQPGSSPGVTVSGATGVTVEDLTIANASTASVSVSSAADIVINSVTASGTGVAVSADQVTGLTVTNDHFANTSGIGAQYGGGLWIASDDLARTGGVYVYQFQGVSIRSNNISFGTGTAVWVVSSANIDLTGNTMYHVGGYLQPQFFLEDDSNATVSWNNGSAGDYGVYLLDSSGARIENDRLPGTSYGIYAAFSSYLTVENNDLSEASSFGFSGYQLTGVVFSNNRLVSSQNGVYLANGSNVVVSGDDCSSFYDKGLDIEYSGNVSILNDRASNGRGTSPTSTAGVYTRDDANLVISGTSAVGNNYGWSDQSSVGVVVDGDNFGGTVGGGYAISLASDAEVAIARTNASHATYGIYSFESNGIAVTNTSFNYAATGIYLGADTSVLFANDQVNQNVGNAVYLEQASQVTLTNLSMTGSGNNNAIFAQQVEALTVTGCNAVRSYYGLYLYAGTGVVASANNFSQSEYGLYLESTTGVSISGNSFWNDNFSFDDVGTNTGVVDHNNFNHDRGWILAAGATAAFRWNSTYPIGGNYWSNYSGTDVKSGPGQNLSGSDRIGDTPFVLNPVTADQYPLMGTWVAHTITFVETGLTNGTPWSVAVNGQSGTSSSNAIVVSELDGATASFSYSVASLAGYHISPASGAGVESGSNLVIAITFVAVDYTTTFSAVGLAANTPWSVTIDGRLTPGTGPSLTAQVPNGTHNFAVGQVVGYSILPASGQFTVSGGPVTVTLTATSTFYTVTFVEAGLPSGTNWSVLIDGRLIAGTGPSLTTQVGNGTHTYAVGQVLGYSILPASGQFTVAGGPVTVTLTATPTLYNVTFAESGLPSGTSWSVTLDGVSHVSTGLTIVFQVQDGSHAFSIASPEGYSVSSKTGSVLVVDGPSSVFVSFTTSSALGTILNSGASPGLLAGLIVVLLLAVVGWTLYLRARRPRAPSPAPPAQLPTGTPPPAGGASPPSPPPSG